MIYLLNKKNYIDSRGYKWHNIIKKIKSNNSMKSHEGYGAFYSTNLDSIFISNLDLSLYFDCDSAKWDISRIGDIDKSFFNYIMTYINHEFLHRVITHFFGCFDIEGLFCNKMLDYHDYGKYEK